MASEPHAEALRGLANSGDHMPSEENGVLHWLCWLLPREETLGISWWIPLPSAAHKGDPELASGHSSPPPITPNSQSHWSSIFSSNVSVGCGGGGMRGSPQIGHILIPPISPGINVNRASGIGEIGDRPNTPSHFSGLDEVAATSGTGKCEGD